jgi:hypothetical protein
VLFFGADPERWLFVLPALWLLAGVLTATLPRRTQAAALILGYLFVCNLGLGILPAHRDTWTRHRAQAVAHLVGPGDLLLFPGHSWDEYVSFFARAPAEPFPVAYYAARDGIGACLGRLEREVAAARARGGQIYALRLFDGRDDDARGTSELEALGLGRDALEALLRKSFIVVPLDVDGIHLARLDPPVIQGQP